MVTRNLYESLLLSYAAGILDEAQSMIIATHLALSPRAQDFVGACEALNGALLERHCAPVAMRGNALRNVLSRLDKTTETPAAPSYQIPEDVDLPEDVLRRFACRKCSPQWKQAESGLEIYEMQMDCTKSAARFMRARPAHQTPRHTHRGLELMLVLDGAMMDDTGPHARGDMVVIEQRRPHTAAACDKKGYVCMVVTTTPVRFTGLAALLGPLGRV